MSPPHACAIGAHRPIDYPIEQIMLSCAPDPDWVYPRIRVFWLGACGGVPDHERTSGGPVAGILSVFSAN
jgi:hypothetical protein